jgi:hypothetical protein
MGMFPFNEKKGSLSAIGLLNKLPFWRVLRLDGVF